jgi:hypothetical protein
MYLGLRKWCWLSWLLLLLLLGLWLWLGLLLQLFRGQLGRQCSTKCSCWPL